ncbi:MAG: S41 family peptidase [Nevskiales bacterium]
MNTVTKLRPDVPMPGACWASLGYGWILDFNARGYTLYHHSRINLLAAEQGTPEDFRAAYDICESSGECLSLRQAGDITRYDFSRIERLPELPVIAHPGALTDVLVNFDTLWQQFDEHYAFSELHGVDWQEVYRRQRPRLTASSTSDELLQVFSDMLLPLNDGHVSLSAGERAIHRLGSMPLRRAMQEAFCAQQIRISLRSTVDAIAQRHAEVFLAPFAATRSPLKTACNGILSWCRLQPDIGYLSVLRLFGFADTAAARQADDLPHTRREVAQFLRDDLAALEPALDVIFGELAGCRALVLDLRINGGGFDRAGMAIANRFADRRWLAFSKRARQGAGFTAEQRFEVSPQRGPGFSGAVYVLISPLCVSAGEILTLCLRALPQVRIVGQNTAGMLSDNLNKPLPNGWELSLSNEVYTASDGQVFESCGIAPDVPMQVLDAERFVPTLQESLRRTVVMIADGGAPLPARHAGA